MARIIETETVNPDELATRVGSTASYGLGVEIRRLAQIAIDHKGSSGVTQRLERSLEQYLSEYDCETKAQIKEALEPDVFFPVTSLKGDALVSWIRDTVVNSLDRPWTLEVPDIPRLDEAAQARVVERLTDELRQIQGSASFTFEELEVVAGGLIQSELRSLREEAEQPLRIMEEIIAQQHEEAGLRKVWGELLIDFVSSLAAIVKGPTLELHEELVWEGNTPVRKLVPKEKLRRVSPFNIFPMPDVGSDPSSGTGLFEVETMSAQALIDLEVCAREENLEGFNSEAIRTVMQNNPRGWRHVYDETEENNEQVRRILNRDPDAANGRGVNSFEILKYYGKVENKHLSGSPVVADIEGFQADYGYTEVEAWIVDTEVIYAVANPYPVTMRPFYVVPFKPRAGSFWGDHSFPEKIRTHQRILNATLRNLLVNQSYSSGPIGEFEQDRLVAGTAPPAITPRAVYAVRSGLNGQRAIRFDTISNSSSEFLNTLIFFNQSIDEFSGVPDFLLGQNVTSGAGATLGGLSTLMTAASRQVKQMLSVFDSHFLEPMVNAFYMHNMVFGDNPAAKGSANVVVRGFEGVIQRELQQQFLIQAMNIVVSMRQQAPEYITDETVVKLLRPTLGNLGVDVDNLIPDPDRVESLQALVDQISPEAGAILTAGSVERTSPVANTTFGTPNGPVGVDGRSQPNPPATNSLSGV